MNKYNTTSYIGVTNSLTERTWQHKQKETKSFTEKYNLNKLVHYEIFNNPYDAICREKQLKKWSRKKKLGLIKKNNSDLRDLYNDLGW